MGLSTTQQKNEINRNWPFAQNLIENSYQNPDSEVTSNSYCIYCVSSLLSSLSVTTVLLVLDQAWINLILVIIRPVQTTDRIPDIDLDNPDCGLPLLMHSCFNVSCNGGCYNNKVMILCHGKILFYP
jgi:hypothetical protein